MLTEPNDFSIHVDSIFLEIDGLPPTAVAIY